MDDNNSIRTRKSELGNLGKTRKPRTLPSFSNFFRDFQVLYLAFSWGSGTQQSIPLCAIVSLNVELAIFKLRQAPTDKALCRFKFRIVIRCILQIRKKLTHGRLYVTLLGEGVNPFLSFCVLHTCLSQDSSYPPRIYVFDEAWPRRFLLITQRKLVLLCLEVKG